MASPETLSVHAGLTRFLPLVKATVQLRVGFPRSWEMRKEAKSILTDQ